MLETVTVTSSTHLDHILKVACSLENLTILRCWASFLSRFPALKSLDMFNGSGDRSSELFLQMEETFWTQCPLLERASLHGFRLDERALLTFCASHPRVTLLNLRGSLLETLSPVSRLPALQELHLESIQGLHAQTEGEVFLHLTRLGSPVRILLCSRVFGRDPDLQLGEMERAMLMERAADAQYSLMEFGYDSGEEDW